MIPAAADIETVDGLRAEVARLSGLLSNGVATLPRNWALTVSEEAVFRALLANDLASVALIVAATGTSPKAVRVHILRIRQKLTAHNVVIETVQRRGWRLIGREQWAAILKPTEGVQ